MTVKKNSSETTSDRDTSDIGQLISSAMRVFISEVEGNSGTTSDVQKIVAECEHLSKNVVQTGAKILSEVLNKYIPPAPANSEEQHKRQQSSDEAVFKDDNDKMNNQSLLPVVKKFKKLALVKNHQKMAMVTLNGEVYELTWEVENAFEFPWPEHDAIEVVPFSLSSIGLKKSKHTKMKKSGLYDSSEDKFLLITPLHLGSNDTGKVCVCIPKTVLHKLHSKFSDKDRCLAFHLAAVDTENNAIKYFFGENLKISENVFLDSNKVQNCWTRTNVARAGNVNMDTLGEEQRQSSLYSHSLSSRNSITSSSESSVSSDGRADRSDKLIGKCERKAWKIDRCERRLRRKQARLQRKLDKVKRKLGNLSVQKKLAMKSEE